MLPIKNLSHLQCYLPLHQCFYASGTRMIYWRGHSQKVVSKNSIVKSTGLSFWSASFMSSSTCFRSAVLRITPMVNSFASAAWPLHTLSFTQNTAVLIFFVFTTGITRAPCPCPTPPRAKARTRELLLSLPLRSHCKREQRKIVYRPSGSHMAVFPNADDPVVFTNVFHKSLIFSFQSSCTPCVLYISSSSVRIPCLGNWKVDFNKVCLAGDLSYYYIPMGEDKYGLTLYRCIRGTSALEGLHQKLRQLVRGYSNSPCFAQSLISEYLTRWNQVIEIAVRGLDSKYSQLYCGDLIEEEIEKMAKWWITPVEHVPKGRLPLQMEPP